MTVFEIINCILMVLTLIFVALATFIMLILTIAMCRIKKIRAEELEKEREARKQPVSSGTSGSATGRNTKSICTA